MSVPDKTKNQNGQPVPLAPDPVLTDPIGMQIALAGLYNSEPAQLFTKSQVGGSAGVYVIQQPTQLIDMDTSKDTTDCPQK